MKFLKQIETLFHAGTAGGLSDGQLLERFLERRDEAAEAAFAALVDRHGSMVLRVCRQVLDDEHDAQDASQATFLVLARKAGSIGRRASVARWLHGVALRVAAKARVAAARRRAHERRGGQIMAARQVVGSDLEFEPDRERWKSLHDELGRLPKSFREPLVLCYLEDLTQEQVAGQLRCPLGTVQSRLARGRAKLKARLTKKGFDFSTLFPGAGLLPFQHTPAPPFWAEATVRMAMQFGNPSGSGIAGAASAALAEEVIRAMVLTKLKLALGVVLCAAVLVWGAATWARQERDASVAAVVVIDTAPPKERPEPEPHPQKVAAPPEWITRTARGIVRDEQGRPVAKAWFGYCVCRWPDTWTIIEPVDRIRERKEPFRDEKGTIVPTGVLGKYFEVRDREGIWRPVHPDDVRRDERPQTGNSRPDAFAAEVPATIDAALAKAQPVFEVRTAKGFWRMVRYYEQSRTAVRTDSEGNFSVEFPMYTQHPELHFASPDFARQACHFVSLNDPDKPLEITLKPVREVHARVIETQNDEPNEDLFYVIYTVDPASQNLYDIPEIGQKGGRWESGAVKFPSGISSPNEDRRLEVRLPAGRYKIILWSNTIRDVADLVVPPGDGPLDLPDIQVRTMGWVAMLGKPAAEIEAVDVDGQPVKLADYRGKVVVLAFWSSANESLNRSVPHLCEIQKRFKDQPLAVLAVHDASLTSLARFKKALVPLRDQIAGEIPIRFLLDRVPIGEGRRPPLRAGERGSGRTADTYGIEGLSTFVIDKNGKMVTAVRESPWGVRTFAIDKNGELVRDESEDEVGKDGTMEHVFAREALDGTLEDLFGLPRSPTGKLLPKLPDEPFALPTGPLVVKGKVVDLEGKPIAGAKLSPQNIPINGKEVRTGPTGDYNFAIEKFESPLVVRIEAPGAASKVFSIRQESPFLSRDDLTITHTGHVSHPLKMGPGAAVTGRVVREGKAVAGLTIGLKYDVIEYAYTGDVLHPGEVHEVLESKTDQHGAFGFPHVLPEQDLWAFAKLGSLKDHEAIMPLAVHTGQDGTRVDLGELHIQRGRTLAGRVVCSDGKAPPRGTVVAATRHNAGGDLVSNLDETARFELIGLPDGPVAVCVLFPDNLPFPGYRLSSKNKCLDPRDPLWLQGKLDRDLLDLTILLEPGTQPERFADSELDPTLVADFDEAVDGPITGVPPKDYPPK